MTPRALADEILNNIEGGLLAGHFVGRLRGELLDPDELLRALPLAQQASPDRLRGFCRRIQKQLERGAGNATK